MGSVATPGVYGSVPQAPEPRRGAGTHVASAGMARRSLRDRFFTPRVAAAIVSPGAVVALVGGAAVGLLVGSGVLGALGLALVAFAARVAIAVPGAARPDPIDPFAVSEPWRQHVRAALQAQRRFTDAVEAARAGPLRERLRDIGERVDTGVGQVWRIAQRADDLVEARRRIDPDALRRRLAAATGSSGGAQVAQPAAARTVEALRSQLATAERLDRVIAEADSRLRLLEARLDEAAARSIELSVQAHDLAELGGLGRDVEHLVDDMEALRQAVEETGGPTAAGSG